MVLKIIVFLGSVRQGRNCTRVGNFIKKELEKKNHNVTIFDPLVMDFPLLKKPLHFHGPGETPPEWLVKYNSLIEEADGFVAISGEYNRCIPPPLGNMLDHFPPKSYRCKPCSIVCYSAGPGGGSTAGMQLRYFLGELGMVTPGFMFTNPVVHQAYAEDGTPDPSNDSAVSKANRLISELEWYAEALKAQTKKCGLP
ncbi:hypothetical protein AVEN_154024-1 [Araneus ventricosus]|uniref:NADPH-dependent FMN reductase-like domain-containing protein n=2 Tax=Araneus ventricosus TaxID=182803 RepID=A0A4Y2IJT1_ARAVE|nr:hypothetical protein AVEN_154024-1 [Araneus ventricosus]